MNTYHFLNNPTVSGDVKSFVRKLEEAIMSSFERRIKFIAVNDDTDVIVNSQVKEKELAN